MTSDSVARRAPQGLEVDGRAGAFACGSVRRLSDPDQPDFSVTAEPAGARTILHAAGELDLASVGRFAIALRDQLADGPVLLDLAGVRFMDSSGVRVLDDVLREADAEGWALTIAPELSAAVRQVLALTGMLEVLPLEPPAP